MTTLTTSPPRDKKIARPGVTSTGTGSESSKNHTFSPLDLCLPVDSTTDSEARQEENFDYLRACTDMGMWISTYQWYREQEYDPKEIYEVCLALHAKGVDMNADAPGGRNWKTPEERAREQAIADKVYARLDGIDHAMNRAYALVQAGQAADALKELNKAIKSASPRKKPINQTIVEAFLAEKGLTARLNVITNQVEFEGVRDVYPKLEPDDMVDAFPRKLVDELQDEYSYVTESAIRSIVGVICMENRYNPVLEYIKAAPASDECAEWDKLVDALGIRSDKFGETLLFKWFLQGIALLHNSESMDELYSADGILVLRGGQGKGKTSVARVLGMKQKWTLTDARLTPDKDSEIRITSHFVTELGELETSISRVDVETMKSFITRARDDIRRPYGRQDTKAARRTSIMATCNSMEFLNDPTGSRRFWVLDVESMDMDKLQQVNALAIWKCAYDTWLAHKEQGKAGTCYRLTREEREMLEERNAKHKRPVKAQEEIEDIFAMVESASEGTYEWSYITVTDFMEEFDVLEKRHYNNRTVGRALDAMGYEKQSMRLNGKVVRVRYLPHKPYVT